MPGTILGTLGVKLDALTADFERKMAAAQSKIQGIAETAKKVSVASGAAFAAMAAGIAVASKAYDTQIQSERGLTAALKATGKATNIAIFKEQASALQDLSGIGDEVILSQHRLLATFGLNRDAILQLMPGLLNLSSTGMADLKTVTMAAAKAMGGMAGALSRYGIMLTDAQKKIIQTGTEQQRLAVITQKLAAFQGQAALASSTAAGQFRHVSGRIGDITEKIGEMLDKPLAKVLNAVQLSLKAVDNVLGNLSPEFKETAGAIILVVTALLGVTSVIAGLVALAPVLIGAFSIIGSTILGTFLPVVAIMALVAAAVAGVILTVGALKKAWDTNLGGIKDAVTLHVNAIKDGWEWLVSKLIVAWDFWADVAKKVMRSVTSWFESQVNAWIGMGRKLGEALGIETLANLRDIKLDLNLGDAKSNLFAAGDYIAERVAAAATATGEVIQDAWSEGMGVVKGALGPLFDDFKAYIEGLGTKLGKIGAAGTGGTVAAGVTRPAAGPGIPGGAADAASGTTAEAGDVVMNAAQNLSSALGEAGGVVGAFLQGLQGGGIFEAFANAIVEILKKTQFIGELLTALSPIMDLAVEAFERILSPLLPLIKSIIELVIIFLHLSMVLSPLTNIIRWLAPVFEYLGKAISWLARVLALVIGTVFRIIASIVGIVKKSWAEKLRRVANQFAAYINPKPLANEMNNAGNAAAYAGGEIEGLGDKANDVAEQLSNIPEGFKVAAARFAAMAPVTPTTAAITGASPSSLTEAIAGRGTQVGTNIENVYIDAVDPDDAWDKMQSSIDRKNFQQTGTSIGTVGPYAAAEGG